MISYYYLIFILYSWLFKFSYVNKSFSALQEFSFCVMRLKFFSFLLQTLKVCHKPNEEKSL